MSSECRDGISILYVDRKSALADASLDLLEYEDKRFRVETATRVDEGLDYFSGNSPDCIVSAYHLQGRNGVEFLEAVREKDTDVPFILFTGEGSEEIASEAITAGVTDYLQKEHGNDQYSTLATRIRNAVEKSRIKSERRRYLDAIGTAECSVSILNEDGYFIYVNEAYARLYGYEPSEMVGKHWELCSQADDRQKRNQILSEVQKFNYWRGTTIGLRSTGNTFGEELTIAVTEYGDYVCTAREIEDRDDPRYDLEQVERQYQAIFEDPNILAGLISPDGTVLEVNQTALEYINTTAEEVAGELFWETPWWDEGTQSLIRQKVDRAANGEFVEYSIALTTSDNHPFYVSGTIRPIFNASGQVTSLIVSARDVTEQRVREQAIDALHSTTRELVMASTENDVAELIVEAAVDILDLEHIGVHWYEEELDGLVPAAWSKSITETIGEPPTLDSNSLAWQVYEDGELKEFSDLSTHDRISNPDTPLGSELIAPLGQYGVAIIASKEENAFSETDHQVVDLLCENATVALDRVNHEQVLLARERELAQSNALLSTLFEALPVGVLAEDESRNVLAANQQMFELFDLPGTPDTIVGADCELMADEVCEMFADDVEFARQINELVENGESVDSEGLSLRDGRTFTRSYRPIEFPDGDGHLWVYHDVTERKQRERELEQQNERLEEFAGIVSHDLRNPLNIAQSYLELAREECDTGHLDAVQDSLDRIHQIVEQTLLLARYGQAIGPKRSVDLAPLVTECWENVTTADAELELEDRPTIEANPETLRHLFENLFRNAVEHGGTDVTVQIGARPDGFYVKDNGVGISNDKLDNIFDPAPSMGGETASLGLTIVNRIVEAHGWDINATNSDDGGAQFEISNVTVS